MSYGSGPPFGARPPGDPGPPPGYGSPPGQGSPPGYGPLPGGAINPYQAPGAGPGVPAIVGGREPAGAALKWLYLGGHVGYWLFAVAGVVLSAVLTSMSGGKSDSAQMAVLLPLVGVVFLVGALVAATVWLHAAWSSVPPEMRYTDAGRWITPGQAVGYMFIPLYNLYWMFAANLGLCEAVNRTLIAQGAQPRAPKGLAIAACVAQLIPYCNLLVGPVLWSVYLFMVDGARKEMVNRAGQAG